MLSLKAFGALDVRDARGRPLPALLRQPKRAALLAYLALSHADTFCRRDHLLAMFWPELDQTHGRNALSQALSFLRRKLGPGVLRTRGTEEVGVDPSQIRTDVREFDVAVAEGRWAEALEAYNGDLLEGMHVAGAAPFADWVDRERTRLREAASDAAWRCAHQRILAGALTEAERAGQRALELVPTDESRVRTFVEALAGAGDRAAAVAFFRRFRARLRQELELEPSMETVAVAEAIRAAGNGASPRPRGRPRAGTAVAGMEIDRAAPASVAAARRRPWWWVGATVTGLAVVAVFPRLSRHPEIGAPPPERPFTVLGHVGGSAQEADRDAVAFLLRTGLDMAHVVRTVPAGEVRRTLRLMERDPDAPLEPVLAQEVAARLGVSTVVIPRLDRFADRHVLSLRVEDAEGGHLHVDARGTAGNRGEIVETVDEVVREVRRKLGESREVLTAREPLPQVLTPSLEALKKYRLAGQAGPGNARVAVLRLWEAVAADTAFAMAWQLMASYYGNYLGEPDSAELLVRQVERHRDRLSEARRADLDLHRRMRSDVALWDVALEDAERAVRRNPRYLSNYSVYLSLPGGLPDSALDIRLRLEREYAAAARSFDPSAPYATGCFINTHYLAAALDRVDEWRTLMDSMDIEVPPGCGREVALFESVAAGEWDRVDSMVTHGPGDWPWPTGVETALLQMAPLRGRIHDASRIPPLRHGETKGLRPDHYGFSNIAHLVLQVAYGLSPEEAAEETFARRGVPRELEARGWDEVTDYVLYGVRESLLGDTLESKRVSQRLRAMRDSATSRTFERGFGPWFALLDVGPAVRRGDWPVVVETLEPVAAGIHEPGVGSMAGDDDLVWWVLAQAHLESGRPDAAIPYLQSVLERPRFRLRGWMLQGYVHPAARFELARAYAQVGDARKSREHYRAFLDLFTDPDPEFAWMVEEAQRAVGEG
jgi:DNA-binding SARP family transcriptional activator/tetratricopeptide (TPR) repeat protein